MQYFNYFLALVVELVDTQDLKSCDPQRSYRFKSDPGHIATRIYFLVAFLCSFYQSFKNKYLSSIFEEQATTIFPLHQEFMPIVYNCP